MWYKSEQQQIEEYRSYKAQKREKSKIKVLMILKGINNLSLTSEDKIKLIAEIKSTVANF